MESSDPADMRYATGSDFCFSIQSGLEIGRPVGSGRDRSIEHGLPGEVPVGAGIERGSGGVGDLDDVVGLHPGGHSPFDLPVVEDVDVLIDHDDLLHGGVSGQGGHAGVHSVAHLVGSDGYDAVTGTENTGGY